MYQKTIEKTVSCSGIGLHGGCKVSLRFVPAPEDKGIVFALTTESGTRFIYPRPDSVRTTGLATTIGNDGIQISTVEHVLAAIRGLGIDNLLIEVQGGEIPIMDGSAASFVWLLRKAGLKTQNKPKKVFALRREVFLERDGRWIKAKPASSFQVSYTIEFEHPRIGRQGLDFKVKSGDFERILSRARTFGFMRDVEMLQQSGLALGGSLDNAVVLDDYEVVNPGGLRFEDEPVRHKVLDFIGDMALMKYPLQGSFEVYCSGHALNNEFLRYLYCNMEECLEEVSLAELPGKEAQPQTAGQTEPLWA